MDERWADYGISKVLYNDSQTIIEKAIIRLDKGNSLGDEQEITRLELVSKLQSNNTFVTVTKNEQGQWKKLNTVSLINSFFSQSISINTDNSKDFLGDIPLILPKRKSFISYYHKDNDTDKIKFEKLTSDIIINKSVLDGDIDSDNSTDYIKHLIQDEYLSDTTVLIVLVGLNTKFRKHVDWEISGALNFKVGETYAGLLGLLLPTHPFYGKNECGYDSLPARLSDNFKSGYAVIASYTDNSRLLQNYIELAFDYRKSRAHKRDNSRQQMQRNTGD